MDDTAKSKADELTETAIADGPFEDFRENYRARLRWLKENQPRGFTEALTHYNDVLVPNVASGQDAINEWLEYGRRLGELGGQGKLVRIDESGRSWPYEENVSGLILHLPDDTSVPALALAVPKSLSDAQRATLGLLVK